MIEHGAARADLVQERFGDGHLESRLDVPPSATDTGALARWQVVKLCHHVDQHIGSKLSQALLATEVRLSVSHFARSFRRTFGCTPHHYVTARRIERARDLLRSPSRPMSEIALTCGLSDQAHLSRLFKQETGLTPSQWRRQYAEDDCLHTKA